MFYAILTLRHQSLTHCMHCVYWYVSRWFTYTNKKPSCH